MIMANSELRASFVAYAQPPLSPTMQKSREEASGIYRR